MTKNQERILDVDVAQEMCQSFLEYSYSVIYSRALPDVRDGLKPVQPPFVTFGATVRRGAVFLIRKVYAAVVQCRKRSWMVDTIGVN